MHEKSTSILQLPYSDVSDDACNAKSMRVPAPVGTIRIGIPTAVLQYESRARNAADMTLEQKRASNRRWSGSWELAASGRTSWSRSPTLGAVGSRITTSGGEA